MNRLNSPRHYTIPGTNLELIDILKIKSELFSDPWEFFLWASAMQYLFRYMAKGEPDKDLQKENTYATWLREYRQEKKDNACPICKERRHETTH